MDVNAWLKDTRLVVCVGSGGVGKTTTAAAIGLWGASQGRRAMVLTIDPAKRLANSLGLDRFAYEGTRIDISSVDPDEQQGELWAMMLDSRRTFDDLIRRIAPTDEARDRILNNHIYEHMSNAFAGSQDYMATEKIYDIVESGKYDLVVLDTPPVKNALDFLESPGRLIKFLDEKVLSWFLNPANSGPLSGLFAGTSAVVLRLLAAVFGKDFILDITEFIKDFEALFEGFKRRHDAVIELFRAEDTGFVTVCAPTESSAEIAVFFQEELAARDLPRAGVVVNQIHRCEAATHNAYGVLGTEAVALAKDLPPSTVPSVLARLGMAHRRLHQLSVTEHGIIERVHESARGGLFYQEVPRLDDEVNDVESLYQVGHHLFENPGEAMSPGSR